MPETSIKLPLYPVLTFSSSASPLNDIQLHLLQNSAPTATKGNWYLLMGPVMMLTLASHVHIPSWLALTGWSVCVCVCALSLSQSAGSEVGFVLLHLHHQVMQVDELGAHGQAAERRLRQHLVEAVVVLDELSQGPLVETRSKPVNVSEAFTEALVQNTLWIGC